MKTKKEKTWDDLEIFTRKGASLAKSFVTVLKSCSFIFNAGFMHLAKLRNYSHVILGYSDINKAITFDFTNDEKAKGALKLTGNGNLSAHSRAFFTYNFLDPDELHGKYEPVKIKIPKIGEMWMIDLNKKIMPLTK
ncbi:hypothetical protein ISS37_09145 [candidate division KSB1 bacterium]|nr:hypothetical protein [candidate division KSB1 bacterium]